MKSIFYLLFTRQMAAFVNVSFTKKFAPIFFFGGLVATLAAAQPSVNPVPLSPNAASLGSYGDANISLYTGQLDFSVPIYEISYNDFSFPISLGYNYNGLKVEDYPGWVGLGWTLTANAVINRQVRGVPDEGTKGYNGKDKVGLTVVSFINGGTFNGFTDYLNDVVVHGQSDSEPDMFFFSIPGVGSGKFFFDETQCNVSVKTAKVIPAQNLQVTGYFNYEAIRNIKPGIIEKFELKDGRGNIYTFNVEERAADAEAGDPDAEDFANSWYISNITTPKNNVINFLYKDTRVIDLPPSITETRTQLLEPVGSYQYDDNYEGPKYHTSAINEVVLEAITWRNGRIEFEEGAERADWNSATWPNYSKRQDSVVPKTLAKVKIYGQANVLLKEAVFSYDYFGSNARLKLNSVQITNGTLQQPPWQFEYLEGSTPHIGYREPLLKQDHWGYYKSESFTTLLPPFQYEYGNLPGNNRTPEAGASSVGLLKKVTYPTGGTKNIQYEANDYLGQVSTSVNLCSGTFTSLAAVEAQITGTDDVYDAQTIVISRNTCVKINIDIDLPCIDGSAEAYLWDGSGTKIFQVTQEHMQAGNSPIYGAIGSGDSFVLLPGVYTLDAKVINSYNCGQTASVSAELLYINSTPSGEDSYANFVAGGHRVKAIEECSGIGPCISKTFLYTNPDNRDYSSGEVVNLPVYHYRTHVYLGNFSGGPGPSYRPFDAVSLSASSRLPIATTSGNVVGYKYVTIISGGAENGIRIAKFSSPKTYPDEGSQDYPFPPLNNMDWKRGQLIEDRNFRSEGEMQVLISKSEKTYNQSSSNQYNRMIGFRPGKVFESQTGYKAVTLADYIYHQYSIQSGWWILEDEVNYTYDQIGSLQTSVHYDYENPLHLQPTKITTTNSRGETVENRMKYVQDVGTISGLSAAEISGIQANPAKVSVIEEKSFVNSTLTSTKLTLYNGINPSAYKIAQGNTPLSLEMTIDQYDSYGNLKSYVGRDQVRVSYLWGYNNTFPVAEIRNAQPTQVFYTSFEAFPGSSTYAYTGASSHTGSYNVTIPGTGKYIVSFMKYNTTTSKWELNTQIVENVSSVAIGGAGQIIDEVRAHPANAQLTTYTYNPLYGMTSKCDANSIVQKMEYDALGRLVIVRDNDNNVLQKVEYQYGGQ